MKIKNKKLKYGFISTIVLILVALIILGYYKISFQTIVSSPIVKDNLSYAWGLVVDGAKYALESLVNLLKNNLPMAK